VGKGSGSDSDSGTTSTDDDISSEDSDVETVRYMCKFCMAGLCIPFCSFQ
jgi:hypothetical protein